jgi:hypothetical protein
MTGGHMALLTLTPLLCIIALVSILTLTPLVCIIALVSLLTLTLLVGIIALVRSCNLTSHVCATPPAIYAHMCIYMHIHAHV